MSSPPLPSELARAYRLLVEHTRDAVIHGRVDFDGDRPIDWVHLDVNAAFVELTGLGGAIGHRATDLLQGIRESDPELFELFGRVARGGAIERRRVMLRALALPLELTAFGTDPGCFVAILRRGDRPPHGAEDDATGREYENRLRLFIEHAPASVAMFDREMRFVAVSARYARDRRVEPWELIGRRLYDVFPGVEARAKHLHDRCLAGAIEAREWDVFPHRDGTEEPFRWELRPWRDGSGGIGGLVLFVEMLGEQHRAEAALHASEERYRALVDNIDGLVFVTDLEGRVTFANVGAAAFGYTPEGMIGHHRDEFVWPEDLPRLREMRARWVEGDQASFEYRLLDASGSPRDVRSFSRPLRIGGKLVGATGVLVDLTGQKRTEEQLRAAQKMEAVGRLAGGVAHDFNNLLSVILSYTEMAVQSLPSEAPLRADLSEVLSAARRAEGLTRQLLAFSRRQFLKPETLLLDELVSGVAKMLRRLIGEDVELEVRQGAALGTIKADRGQLEQVLMNLAVNARDAMPDGGRLTIETAELTLDEAHCEPFEVAPGAYVQLTVTDGGCGMDEATRARAFEPFFTTKPIGKGTGLGLSTVYGIVRQSGGGLTLRSEKDRGTTFRIVFPRKDEPPKSAEPRAVTLRRVAAPERVLVVDDEPAVREAVRRALVSNGYEVLTAAGPAEALSLFEQHGASMQLVISDVVMPGMSGRALVARLRERRPTLKVLFVSGYTDDEVTRGDALADPLLHKPFDRHSLIAAVRGVLDRR